MLMDRWSRRLVLLALVLVLGSGLLGTVIASLCDKIEMYVFDFWRARKMGISRYQFDDEWLRYVDSLEVRENSKNNLRVTWMFFEMRCGLAGLLLSAAYLYSVYRDTGSLTQSRRLAPTTGPPSPSFLAAES